MIIARKETKVKILKNKIFHSLSLRALEESKARLIIAYLILVIIVVVASVFSQTFTRPHNIFNVLRQGVALGLVSIGQTFIILTGGVDLSVSSTVSLTSCLTAGLMEGRVEAMVPVILFVLFIGVTIGFTNGLIVSELRVPPLITTLGMMSLIQGVVLLYTHSPIGMVPWAFAFLSEGYVGPVPFAVIFFALLFALAWFVLKRTTFGRYVYAVGGSEEIAYLAGIKTRLIINITYIIGSVAAASSGLFLASRCGSGDPLMGVGYDFDSITAVIIGGTSLAGGRGSLIGTLAGVFIMCVLNNIMNLLGVFCFWQWVVKGMILIVALSTYRVRR